MSSPKINPLMLIGLVLALTALLAVIYFSLLAPVRSAKPIKFVSGEWAPYTGERLESYGIATAVVSQVLTQMGYRPEYEFMPWQLGFNMAATSQQNDHVRGIFPYSQTENREATFYFSDSIIEIENAVFYHQQNNPGGREIHRAEDLADHRILTLEGYEYPGTVAEYLPARPCPKKDTLDALRHLHQPRPLALLTSDNALRLEDLNIQTRLNEYGQPLTGLQKIPLAFDAAWIQSLPKKRRQLFEEAFFLYVPAVQPQKQTSPLTGRELESYDLLITDAPLASALKEHDNLNICHINNLENAIQTLLNSSKPAVLVEALEVVEQQLGQRLPQLIPLIQQAGFSEQAEQRVMFSRSNPNNLALKNKFNQQLAALRANESAYAAIVRNAKAQIDMARAVSLVPLHKEQLVFLYPAGPQQCQLAQRLMVPKGSKAVVKEWHPAFLTPHVEVEQPMVKIKLLNGPLASDDALFCVDGRSVTLP